FVRWLWSFRRSCSQARFDAGVRALLALNRRTLELFDAYRDAGLGFEMHDLGLVVAARTHEGLDLYRAIFRRLRELGYEGGAIAAGLPTVSLLRRLGVRLPIVGARGYSVTIEGRGTPPRHALYLAEAKLGLSPFAGGVRIAGVFELGARGTEAPPAAGERLLAA